jgi:kynureninase-like protein
LERATGSARFTASRQLMGCGIEFLAAREDHVYAAPVIVDPCPRASDGAVPQSRSGGVKCDFREPNMIRAASTPLYNTFHEVWRLAKILAEHQ